MKSNDKYLNETTKDKDNALLTSSDSQKGIDRKRIVFHSFPFGKEYDADDSSSDDGLSYGSDTNSSSVGDYESRCSFSDDDELSKDEEVFSEDEVDFDLGNTFEEITSSELEDECLFYFSCESFESSFDLDEPLYTIQEEKDSDSDESCHIIQGKGDYYCYYAEDDDDDDDSLAMVIKRSDAFQMFQETKEDSDPYISKEMRNFTDFYHLSIPYSFESPFCNSSCSRKNSLFLSDIEHDIILFTILEEPELEEASWQEERLSNRIQRQR
jgi:hypothetical protein